ncbi:hypothetical protein Tco_0363078 [Tanacetum coccineum]
MREAGMETQKGATGPTSQTQTTPSPSLTFVKENIDVLRTLIKELDHQAKAKATPRKLVYVDSEKEALDRPMTKGFSDRFSLESTGTSDTRGETHSAGKGKKGLPKGKEPSRLRRSKRLENRSRTKERARRKKSKPRERRSEYQETSTDSESDEGSEDTCEDLNSPYKRPKPTPFTPRITRFKYQWRAKLPRNISVYEGNKDPKDHLSIFSAAAEQEERPMPICQKFLEEFSQQKRYVKDPTEIHGIKRRQNESLQTFMDRFKSESSHIKGAPPVLRISVFMHGHGYLKLTKKLNDKIPKTMDEMFERVKAFIRGEMAAGSTEMVRPFQGDKGNTRPVWFGGQKRARNRNGPKEVQRNMGVYTPYPRRDTFTSLTKTSKEILAMEGISFPEPPPLIGTEGRNHRRPYEEERSGLTEELTFSEIPQNSLTDEPIILEEMIEGHQIRRIHVDSGSSSEIMYEHCFRNFNTNVRSSPRKCKASLVGRNKIVLMEFAIVKCRSPCNVLVGRTGMRSLGAVVSTIHSMIKFPTDQGVVTMEISRETLWECRQLEKMLGSWEET